MLTWSSFVKVVWWTSAPKVHFNSRTTEVQSLDLVIKVFRTGEYLLFYYNISIVYSCYLAAGVRKPVQRWMKNERLTKAIHHHLFLKYWALYII